MEVEQSGVGRSIWREIGVIRGGILIPIWGRRRRGARRGTRRGTRRRMEMIDFDIENIFQIVLFV
jgi:hypothetical protein